jgi:hypothetical protein
VTASAASAPTSPRLRCGLVLRSEEDACQVVAGGEVELDEVERLYTEHGLWDSAFGA